MSFRRDNRVKTRGKVNVNWKNTTKSLITAIYRHADRKKSCIPRARDILYNNKEQTKQSNKIETQKCMI